MAAPDPHSPAWTIYWTLKRALGTWIKPKDEHRPHAIADQVVKDLRMSNWHLIQGPTNSGWDHDPGAIRLRQERHQAFERKLRELEELGKAEKLSGDQGSCQRSDS